MAAVDASALAWKRQNGWAKLSAEDRCELEDYCQRYLRFSSEAKTEREAYQVALAMAVKAGYSPWNGDTAVVKPGDKYYFSCGDKTLMLVHVGQRELSAGVHILGAHTDAPRLDAKPVPIYEDSGIVLLDTHYYGGIKKYHWVSQPLALHGTVVREDGSKVVIVIGEDPADPVFTITDLLPHLGKDQATKTLGDAISGESLNVLFGSIAAPDDGDDNDGKGKGGERVKDAILALLHDKYGINEEDLISAELELVPAGRAREAGLDRSLLLAYAHDDRVCAYAALEAILALGDEVPQYSAVLLLCDKEEIGSVGATGMQSRFFENSIAELVAAAALSPAEIRTRQCLQRSRMLSADVCALHDPNYPEVSSPNNMPKLNAGVVLAKYGGSRGKSGSSDASAEFMAVCRAIFNAADVKWQTGELGKVDQGGGGTIAMFLARYGMDVVDCGPGLLSMHAPWEVVGKLDAYMTRKAYLAFLRHEHK